MFERNLHCDGHTRRFLIKSRGADGWEVREERTAPSCARRSTTTGTAWSARGLGFQEEILTLTRQGWTLESV